MAHHNSSNFHAHAKQPVLCVGEPQDWLVQLSKAALVDLVWDILTQVDEEALDADPIAVLRERAEVTLRERGDKQPKRSGK